VYLGTDAWRKAAPWLSLVAAADLALTILDKRFRRANPPDSELVKWGWARAACLGARGLAWGLGPILIYAKDDTISLVVPVWGIINLLAASAYTASPFLPCLVTTTIGGIAPAAVWLMFQNTEGSHLSALLLLLSIPFIFFIGMQGRRNTEALIGGRLDLAEALDKQRQQTRLVEEALAERTRFFSAASHDLRQPLQAIGFYTSLLTRNRGKDDSDILSRLEDCAGNLERQFNAIMEIAETDSAVRQAKIIAISLERIFQRVAASIRLEAEIKKLKVRVAPTSIWVMVEPELLERVLVNLAANAVRYTAVGGILIGARRRDGAAELWIVDTGVGIAEEHHQIIFEEFYQIGNSARAPEQGYGLGLSIVRRFCIGMKWPLGFSSVVNKGSIFKVTVPIAAPGPQGSTPEGTHLPVLTNAPRLAVVIVDDDPFVRDAMERLITSWGLRVECCCTGDQAIAILQQRDSSYRWEALLDYRLAGSENGLIVADRISRLFGRSVGVTLMTAETDASIFEQAAQRVISILRKPIQPVRLRAVLTALAKSALHGTGASDL
jgi:two-component system, sensor histidine kinase